MLTPGTDRQSSTGRRVPSGLSQILMLTTVLAVLSAARSLEICCRKRRLELGERPRYLGLQVLESTDLRLLMDTRRQEAQDMNGIRALGDKRQNRIPIMAPAQSLRQNSLVMTCPTPQSVLGETNKFPDPLAQENTNTKMLMALRRTEHLGTIGRRVQIVFRQKMTRTTGLARTQI